MKRLLILLIAFGLHTATAQAQNVDRTVTAKPGGLLTMNIETGGDIEIRGWDRDEVHVVAEFDSRDADRIDFQVSETSRGVAVRSEYRTRRNRSGSDVQVVVRVPSTYDLDVETMGGDLLVTGISGRLEGSSMGGDLELSALNGIVQMSTMGGDVSLSDSEVDGKVSTMGGDVDLRNVTGTVNGSTMGGDISYNNVRSPNTTAGETVTVETMGGDIEIDEALFGADVETMGGDITINKAAEFVRAGTMGGDITVREVDGWIELETMGGDVEAHMVGGTSGDRHVDIESKGGDILLTVPRGLAMTFDIEIVLDDEDDEYRIESDFDLNINLDDKDSRWRGGGRVHATGTTGNGANKIRIKTYDGDVTIREGR